MVFFKSQQPLDIPERMLRVTLRVYLTISAYVYPNWTPVSWLALKQASPNSFIELSNKPPVEREFCKF